MVDRVRACLIHKLPRTSLARLLEQGAKLLNHFFMKKTLLLSVLLFSSTIILAQDSSYFKNMLGTNFSTFSRTSDSQGSTSKQTSFSIEPVYARYLKQDFALGVRFGYGSTKIDESSSFTESTVLIEPFARIHESIGEKVSLFLQPSIAARLYFAEGKLSEVDDYAAGVDLGLLYFFKKRFSAELVFSGLQYRYRSESSSTRGELRFLSDLVQPDVGLRYYFGK